MTAGLCCMHINIITAHTKLLQRRLILLSPFKLVSNSGKIKHCLPVILVRSYTNPVIVFMHVRR